MTWYPDAVKDPLGPQTALKMSAHDIFCVHTMAGPFDVVRAMFKVNGYQGTESHFGLRGSGKLYQWQDLDYRADANYQGNPRVISLESADMGEDFPSWSGSNVPPWTDDQLQTITDLGIWLCGKYDIPPVLIPDTKSSRRGLAYHRQGIKGNWGSYKYKGWTAGELWSTGTGKVCPGDKRIEQFVEEVVPAIAKGLKPRYDFVVVAVKGDRRVREKFGRLGPKYDEWTKNKIRRGWHLDIERKEEA